MDSAEQPLSPFGATFLANLPGTPAWWMIPLGLPFFTTFPVLLMTQPNTSKNNSGGTVTLQPLPSKEKETHEEDHVEVHDNEEGVCLLNWDPLLK